MGLLQKLIEQCKEPKGFIGTTMLKIMNSAHYQMMIWGLSKIDVRDDSVVLDVGCGGGKTIKLLSGLINTGKVYGVDYSEQAVETTLKENKKAVRSGRVIVEQGDVSSLPFSNNFFNTVTAFQTHYFWPDMKKSISEIFRVLKPNGQFLLVAELYKINYHMKDYKTTESMKKILFETGFDDVKVFKTTQNICFVGIE